MQIIYHFTFYVCQDRNKQTEAPFMAQEEVEAVLQKRVGDCPEEILSELAGHLVR